jgi:hypothetical protein
MRVRDINKMFEMAVGTYGLADKIPTSIAEYYINSAIDKYWKSRISGLNSTGDKIDDTNKRVADIRSFIKPATLIPTETEGKIYTVALPEDFNMLLSDSCKIYPLTDDAKKCWEVGDDGDYIKKEQDTQEGRINTINQILRNSLSEYRLNNGQARPVRIVKGDNIEIYTDGQYAISEYNISYIIEPEKINFIGATKDSEYTFLPDSVISEVVRLAAEVIKDTIGGKKTESLREVNTIE